MLLSVTLSLCLLLLGVGFIHLGKRHDQFNPIKYTTGVLCLTFSFAIFLIVGYVCVRQFNQMRQKQERLADLITKQNYKDEELLELSVKHIQKQICGDCKKIGERKFLPTVINVEGTNEDLKAANDKMERIVAKYKQVLGVNTLS